MKTVSLWKVAVMAVAVGSSAAGVALAEGGKVQQHNGNSYGETPRTGTSSATATAIQQRDRTRDQLRDGSCKATATQQRDRTRDQLRDGSCQAK